jgi:TRAP-type C4-dicarboxylate transport system permease small subunit
MGGNGWAARLAAGFEGALLTLLGLVMAGIVVLNFSNVAGRYLLSSPVPAADEIMTFAMVWGVFLGAGVVTLRGAHLRMDLVLGVLPARMRRLAEALATVCLLLVLGFVAVQSIEYLDTVGSIGLTSMAAGLPMAWVHAAVPIGFGLMILAALLRLAASGR